jgi:hypothetical protein
MRETITKGIVMAKLLGPDFMSLQVRDLAVSRAFYIDILGFAGAPYYHPAGGRDREPRDAHISGCCAPATPARIARVSIIRRIDQLKTP